MFLSANATVQPGYRSSEMIMLPKALSKGKWVIRNLQQTQTAQQEAQFYYTWTVKVLYTNPTYHVFVQLFPKKILAQQKQTSPVFMTAGSLSKEK